MRRLLILPALAAIAVAETYRRGYAAAVLYGCRQWINARPDRFYEPDHMA